MAGAAAVAILASAATAATVSNLGNANDVDPLMSTAVVGGSFIIAPDIRTGSLVNQYRSPFEGTAAFAGTSYFNILGGQARVLILDQVSNTLAFLWGSPDTYNYVDLILGGINVASLSLGDIPPAVTPGRNANLVSIFEGGGFDSVVFTSNTNSFELSNIAVSAVPLPAGGLLLIFGLAGLAAVRRRKA